ncbi:uncharacterized protein [Triticum aestivum]|uniref:uncharacterized protein n=1 Tax=Triticum aestivum TaxID=4565 RepID=UPI001D014C3F|nr:uncharacterized protein LOC123135018 [Triticum aestivum]
MVAFAVVPALRRGRGPAAAAMALGRRRLAGADPSHAPTRRWFASVGGNGGGGPVANSSGKGTGGPGAGMGAAPSWTGCTGACAKEVLDLRAEMLWSNHQIWMRIDNLAQENGALRSLIVFGLMQSTDKCSRFKP